MTVDRWMTEEWNRYFKGKGGPQQYTLLCQQDLFDAFAAVVVATTREAPESYVPPVTPTIVVKSCRMYRLSDPGWKLVIEGVHGRQVGVYEPEAGVTT